MMRDGRGLLYSFFVSHDSIDLPSSCHRREGGELIGPCLSRPNHVNLGVSMVTPLRSHRVRVGSVRSGESTVAQEK